MKTLFSVQLIRRLISSIAATSLVLGSAALLTGCGPDTSQTSSSPDRTERQQAGDPARSTDERQAGRDDQTRQVTGNQRQTQLSAMSNEDLLGSSVRSRNGNEEIGTIEEVLVDGQGNPIGVVLEVGDFLEIDEKRVALDWNRVSLEDQAAQRSEGSAGTEGTMTGQRRMADGDSSILVDTTRQELETAPAFDRNVWEREHAGTFSN